MAKQTNPAEGSNSAKIHFSGDFIETDHSESEIEDILKQRPNWIRIRDKKKNLTLYMSKDKIEFIEIYKRSD